MPPGCGYRSGIGLTWYGRGVSVGFDFGLGWNAFSYVPIGNFCDWHVSRHFLPENRLRAVHGSAVTVNRIAVHNHTLVNNGIEPNTIARASRTKIPTMHVRETAALPVNHAAKPERLESSGNSLTVVRPQLPKNPPAVVTTASASRGTATTHARPLNLGNSAQATATARLNAATPPNSGGTTPHTTAANVTPPLSGVRDAVGRDSVEPGQRRQESVPVAPPNSGVRTETANRPQATTPPPTRQVAPPTLRNETAAPAVRNPTPPAPHLAPPQTQAPVTRPAPAPQTAPAPRANNNNPMIRSYAEPQRYIPNVGAAMPPAARLQNPVMGAQPSVHPQVISPRAELARPSVSMAPTPPVHSAPSAPAVSHSAPSSGGGGGNSHSSGGGRNRGD